VPIEEMADTLPDPVTGEAGGTLDLEEAIARLPAGARQVLVLVGIYGHSHEEAAEMLGIAVGTCKSQLHRARQLLGERLALPEGT
jgi:RNA polymerase sigma-70 factor (ECF subfamily)